MAGMQSSPESPQPLARVVQAVRGWVERCGQVWVEGQVIELRRRTGARQFLTLRDRLAEVSVTVSMNGEVLQAAGPLREGMTVTCLIRPVVYARNGSLSFDCSDLRPSGEGRLLAQLEQRRRTLAAEGLFDPALKMRLPFLPKAIGLVTAAGSAAEKDVIENVRRRWPAARLEVAHVLVQGPHSAEQVMGALSRLEANPEVDVVVVARGGGSLEDLLGFSDEGLVRAVAAMRTPVVSAVGHEQDRPLLDEVADVRASTPTDAAKKVVPDALEEADRIRQARQRIGQAVLQMLAGEQRHLDQYRSRPALTNPLYGFEVRHSEIDNLQRRCNRAIEQHLRGEERTVAADLARVRAMSPRATLERGYAIVADTDSGGITSVGEVSRGDALRVMLADGNLDVSVTGTTVRGGPDSPDSNHGKDADDE